MMGDCGSCGPEGAGPFSEGAELVDFVSNAHGGTIKSQPIPDGGLVTHCRECKKEFTLKTFVGACPHCGGVHAVSPPRCNDEKNIQFAGKDYKP
ncbi:MAG: hypothetical protein ACE5FU_11885 [Nitrospinota bacterium]